MENVIDDQLKVSIHAPVKGRLSARSSKDASISFNPRPREGATQPKVLVEGVTPVSIHAPVKGRQRRPGSARRAGYGAHFRERTSRSLQLFFSS